MFPDPFETDRLRFDRLDRAIDARDLYELRSRHSPTVEAELEYLPYQPMETVADAADLLDRRARQWDQRERAAWLVVPREGEDGAGEPAGTAGLICRWEQDLAMPAIWLRKPFWGWGYSGERADALLEIAFERLDVEVVAIPLHADNEKSYRAVEKYVKRHGGRYEGLLRNHSGRYEAPVDHHRFSISRAEYRDSG